MTCDDANLKLCAFAGGELPASEMATVQKHVEICNDCRLSLRGIGALAERRDRPVEATPEGLFERVVGQVVATPPRPAAGRFWQGAGVGALAASLLAFALFFAWSQSPAPVDRPAEFLVSLDEPRPMNIAFETDRALEGATITILLAGNVEIDGYGGQRELSWSENLDAGVNRLTLPVIANGFDGGQMIVRLEHPLSEQVFIVRLPVES